MSALASASSAAARRLLKVDVISDTICPWCFVGKRRLEGAIKLAAAKGIDVSVQWHPFFLDPSLPKEGVDKMKSYVSKFGEARVKQMIPYIKSVGEKAGINFSYGGVIANTMDSHRIMEFAFKTGGAALQDRVCEALMHFYFELEGNLGDVDALVRAVVPAGIDEKAVRALLATDEGAKEVVESVRSLGRKFGVSGVPFFVIGGKEGLSGAQEESVLLEAFESALES